jgi:hypothetical protein
MAVTLTINGVDFSFPQAGESPGWGSAVQGWASAVTSGMLQKAGGAFTLTADADFGATYGLKSIYYKSRATSVSSTGVVRLGNAEYLSWRNAADSADLGLRANSSDILEFNGNPITTLALGAADTVLKMNSGGTASEYGLLADANIDGSAAIAYSKLAVLTADKILASDVSGVVSALDTATYPSLTELAYVKGVTSAVQTQIGAKVTKTGDALSGTFTGTPTFSGDITFSSTGAIELPEGSTAQRPGTPANGMVRFNNDSNVLEYYGNSAWNDLGGGGGGGSLQWRAQAPTAPVATEENNELVYEFSSSAERLYASVRVPQSYNSKQVKLYTTWYHSTAGAQVDFQSTATLVRSGLDLVTSTTNQETDTETIASSVQNQAEGLVFNLTSSTGTVNGTAVSPGDLILIALARTDSNAGTAKFLPNGIELTFS